MICLNCDGTGKLGNNVCGQRCTECHGTGYIHDIDSLIKRIDELESRIKAIESIEQKLNKIRTIIDDPNQRRSNARIAAVLDSPIEPKNDGATD